MDGNQTAAAVKKRGITASDLKYIAILTMLIDHCAYLFIDSDSLLYGCMRMVGRITAPVMCFFISEGYHYTRNLKKYFFRLGIFAVISHFAFAFCFSGGFFENVTESVIATLFLSLLAVHIMNSEKTSKAFRLPLILLILYLAERCDWGADAVLFTLAFEFARGSRKNQVIAYGAVAFIRRLLPLVPGIMRDPSLFGMNWYKLGLLLPIPLLLLYNGEKGGGKYTKWVFYIFYPAHLLLLGYFNWKYLQ